MRLFSAMMTMVLAAARVAYAQETLDDIDQGKSRSAPSNFPATSGSSSASASASGSGPVRGRDSAGSGAAAESDGVESDGTERKSTTEVNGYLASRISYTRVDSATLLPTRDVPSLSVLLEANSQLRVNLGRKLGFVYSDLSLLYQQGWLFYADNGEGGQERAPNHDVPSLRPLVVPSELYLSLSPRPWLNVLAGKKRITWGSGVAFNPTDLINPPKDPTDPNFQRAGNWMVRIEAPFEKFTVTGLFAPQALYAQAGIPYAFFRYPDYPPSDSTDLRDDKSHYLAAARLYMLVWGADVNLMYYFSNHYQDGFGEKSRFGMSFSRYLFTDYELHVDALLSLGSARRFPDHACATGTTACDEDAALAATKLDSNHFYPRIVVGTRRQFSDDALLSIEYYYQSDGYSKREFRDTLELLGRAKSSAVAAHAVQPPPSSAGGALPQRYTFDPYRRHYLIASYTKPRIHDDWTVGAMLIAGLEDLSGLFSASVAWTPEQWLTLSAYGYVPIRGLGVGEVNVGNQSLSEYSLIPFDFRAMFEARVFY